jgi:hypothetical protein
MAVIPVVNPTLAGGVFAKTSASAPGTGDTFPAQSGGVYLVCVENGATPTVISFDDVNTPAPDGTAPAAGWSDPTVAVAATTNKVIRVAANRYLNAGFVKVISTPETTVKLSVFGPL